MILRRMIVRRQLSSALLRGAVFLGGAVLFGCTVQKPDASPGPSPVGERTSAERERDIVEPAGRWKTRARVGESMGVTVKEGHSHVDLGLRPHNINCFVYDAPLDTGPALTRLLSAMETGIEFESFGPLSVEVVGQNLVAGFDARFVTTTQPSGQSGTLRLAISDRFQFPVVCTQEFLDAEGNASTESFMRVVRPFVERLEPDGGLQAVLPEPMKAALVEHWVLRTKTTIDGWVTKATYEIPDAGVAMLVKSVIFASNGSTMVIRQSIHGSLEDEHGIVSGSWISFDNDVPESGFELQRQGSGESRQWRYHAKPMRLTGGGIGSTFVSGRPLIGSFQFAQLLRQNQGKHFETTYLGYVPLVNPRGPTEVKLLFEGEVVKENSDGTLLTSRVDSQGDVVMSRRSRVLVSERLSSHPTAVWGQLKKKVPPPREALRKTPGATQNETQKESLIDSPERSLPD